MVGVDVHSKADLQAFKDDMLSSYLSLKAKRDAKRSIIASLDDPISSVETDNDEEDVEND